MADHESVVRYPIARFLENCRELDPDLVASLPAECSFDEFEDILVRRAMERRPVEKA